MSCPICKKVMCDHTPKERGQTLKEILEDTKKEWRKERKKRGGQKNDVGGVPKWPSGSGYPTDVRTDGGTKEYPNHYPSQKDVLDW